MTYDETLQTIGRQWDQVYIDDTWDLSRLITCCLSESVESTRWNPRTPGAAA
jgi:hypothetical protein